MFPQNANLLNYAKHHIFLQLNYNTTNGMPLLVFFFRNRLNVAVSRAKKKAIVICSKFMLQPSVLSLKKEFAKLGFLYLQNLQKFAQNIPFKITEETICWMNSYYKNPSQDYDGTN